MTARLVGLGWGPAGVNLVASGMRRMAASDRGGHDIDDLRPGAHIASEGDVGASLRGDQARDVLSSVQAFAREQANDDDWPGHMGEGVRQ